MQDPKTIKREIMALLDKIDDTAILRAVWRILAQAMNRR